MFDQPPEIRSQGFITFPSSHFDKKSEFLSTIYLSQFAKILTRGAWGRSCDPPDRLWPDIDAAKFDHRVATTVDVIYTGGIQATRAKSP
jgi:hypothetical protein